MITLRFGTSTNGLAGAYHPPTRPPLANDEPEPTHPVCCGWCVVRSVSGSHWAKSALFLERYITGVLSYHNEEVKVSTDLSVSSSFSGAAPVTGEALAVGSAVQLRASLETVTLNSFLFLHIYTTDTSSLALKKSRAGSLQRKT